MAEDQDKTEKPSAFRLREARNKGQAAKSAELSAVIVLAVFCFALVAGLSGVAVACAVAMRSAFALAGAGPELGPGLAYWTLGAFKPVWQALVPSIFALLIAAIAANVLQTGVIFSTEPLKPDVSRLNPAKGLKRVFSPRTLWDLCRLLLKLGILAILSVWLARALWQPLMTSAGSSPSAIPGAFAALFSRVVRWLLFVLGLVAVLDLLFSRREFMRKLRMSRRELKDEHKRHEGDPAIRSKRRRLARDLLKRVQSIGQVSGADVVLTNPTHVAVALQYRSSRMLAPVVLSKGAGWMSARIRRAAARHGIPIVRSPELARALFRECALDEAIPAPRYAAVGAVYRWVMARPGHKVHS